MGRCDSAIFYREIKELRRSDPVEQASHDVLIARLSRRVSDRRLLALIGRYLRAGVLAGEVIQATELGTPHDFAKVKGTHLTRQ